MSEGLRERFINALTAMIELFDVVGEEHAKRIATLEDTVKRLKSEMHDQQLEIGRLRQDSTDHARWFAEIDKETHS